MKRNEKKSTVAWIIDFAGTHENIYLLSMCVAIVGVV